MGKKLMQFKTKGMNRDLSVSAFNPEFAFENMNLRLSTNDGNTLLSWVNEKGTAELTVSIPKKACNFHWPYKEGSSDVTGTYIIGVPIGVATLNHKLVLFTHEEHEEETEEDQETIVTTIKTDYIYSFEYNSDRTSLLGTLLYFQNLNFSTSNPIETLVSYEAENIQKIYWTDGINQPRIINIAESPDNFVRLRNFDNYQSTTCFDFVPAIKTNEIVTVSRNQSGGTFPSGIIQYCFTYINKYGQQSNIVWVSSLYYLSLEDRGAAPDENINNSFSIQIQKPDASYEYIRLYSIVKTSLNTTPFVKAVTDIKIADMDVIGGYKETTFIDNGTMGFSIDPVELLYIGGKEISALTMTEKDKKLFIGNLTTKSNSLQKIQNYYDDTRDPSALNSNISFISDNENKRVDIGIPTGFYSKSNTLLQNSSKITTFKGGEWYRFGLQFQRTTGEWSEPIWVEDKKNNIYPPASTYNNVVNLTSATTTFDISLFTDDPTNSYYIEDFLVSYIKVRPVIVFPSISDRTVLCQGVLNPTVFNVKDRADRSPYSQSSWYFRPYVISEATRETTPEVSKENPGNALVYTHYNHLYSYLDAISWSASNPTEYIAPKVTNIEIQGSYDIYGNPFSTTELSGINTDTNTQFFVDQSVVTLNSPDIEFDTEVQSCATDDLQLKIIGAIPITANVSAHEIQALERLETTPSSPSDNPVLGDGELSVNVKYTNRQELAGNRLVADYIWKDVKIIDDNGTIKTSSDTHRFPIFPWHRTGSLNDDWRTKDTASSWMNLKKESNLLFSSNTEYFTNVNISPILYTNTSVQFHLTENEQVLNYRLNGQNNNLSKIDYYPNIDKVLYNSNSYYSLEGLQSKNNGIGGPKFTSPISMKFKSTTHAAVALSAVTNNTIIPLLPCAKDGANYYGKFEGFTVGGNSHVGLNSAGTTFWGESLQFSQSEVDISSLFNMGNVHKEHNFLWLGELQKTPQNRFGGSTKEALKSNTWLIGGKDFKLSDYFIDNGHKKINIYWTEGDTYYQRYDCLKTYPFTPEDTNQLVEILSFMCETHVNLDGRYDRNRGQIDNTNMSPHNFNLMNDVYSQKDNFFSYRITDDKETVKTYPNWVNYTKTKESGADVDMWTNITLSSMLELDGDKGELRALKRFNDQILAFQDSGISQILYNENVQIASTQGVPIEIANSGKVDGKRYISDTIGCSNKWSMTTTPMGIYFMDNNEKSIYLFNGQLNNLSVSKGFNTWCKQNIPSPSVLWNPKDFDNFVAYYDKQNQDVLFINKTEALAYSEKLGTFTSFYSYENTPYFVNLDDLGLWVGKSKDTAADDSYKIWRHNAGDYCKFFDINQPYSTILVGNPEPAADKTFTNLEFRATVEREGTPDNETSESFNKFFLPFDYLEAWNEFQHGKADLDVKKGHASMMHNLKDMTASLNRKFRIWRCDIPRDNWPLPSVTDADNTARVAAIEAERKMGITRYIARPLDRMRNTWVYMKLGKENATNDSAVTTHNQTVTGAAWEGKEIPDSSPTAYYTKETANEYNTEEQIEGAWMYGQSLPKAEIHDVVMTYFD